MSMGIQKELLSDFMPLVNEHIYSGSGPKYADPQGHSVIIFKDLFDMSNKWITFVQDEASYREQLKYLAIVCGPKIVVHDIENR
jgi:hypothetical protein